MSSHASRHEPAPGHVVSGHTSYTCCRLPIAHQNRHGAISLPPRGIYVLGWTQVRITLQRRPSRPQAGRPQAGRLQARQAPGQKALFCCGPFLLATPPAFPAGPGAIPPCCRLLHLADNQDQTNHPWVVGILAQGLTLQLPECHSPREKVCPRRWKEGKMELLILCRFTTSFVNLLFRGPVMAVMLPAICSSQTD